MVLSDDKFVTKPALHRDDVAVADTGDISLSTTVVSVVVGMNEVCIVEFSNASAVATIALALFDKAKTFMGITYVATFTADAALRNGAAGPYVSPIQAFDVTGASFVRAIVKTLSAGTIDIFLGELRVI